MTDIGSVTSLVPGGWIPISVPRRCILLAGLWLAGVALADEVRVIQLHHRSAAEIVPLVRPLLGPEDVLSGLDYRLIVRTSDVRLREIERVIAQVDTAQRQLRLTVKHVLAHDAANILAALSGNIGLGGHVRAAVPGSGRHEDAGVVLEKRDGDDYLRARARRETSQTASMRTEVLRVAEGQNAFIQTGRSGPYSTHYIEQKNGMNKMLETPDYDSTSGFEVLPRMAGERVTLTITPRQASPGDPRRGATNVRELATTVQIPLAAWIDLGSVLDESSAANRSILQGSRDSSGQSWTVLLRVDDVTSGARRETAAPPAPALRR